MSRFCLVLLVAGLAGVEGVTAPTTCGQLKQAYRDNTCCGNPSKAVTVAPACPYNFNKPSCAMAEPQAPRDLSTTNNQYNEGLKVPKMATLTKAQADVLPKVNVHFHLGAEHKSDEYNDATASVAYDATHSGGRRLASDPRPGFMCSTSGLTAAELQPYNFQYCKGDVVVGKSYEIHFVHSSAGYTATEIANNAAIDGMDDGLGGAANGRGQLNPQVVVEGQVFQIVNGGTTATNNNLINGWHGDNAKKVMYPGSTTGPSHDNSVCSPYVITWHVDKRCHKVLAKDFDKMCKDMKDNFGMSADLYPHGSRKLVAKEYVCPKANVQDLA